MDIEQILAPYRGKNVALQVDTQEDWDAIIPYMRKNDSIKFTSFDFLMYSPVYIFMNIERYETFDDSSCLPGRVLIKFSDLKTNVYECW